MSPAKTTVKPILRPLDTGNSAEMQQVLGWLQRDAVIANLDYGHGRRAMTLSQLVFHARNPANSLMIFAEPEGGAPVGLVGFQGINRDARTAEQWGVRGEFDVGGPGITVEASWENLRRGFEDYNLNTVTTWTVATNWLVLATTRRLGFREWGRQRQCHRVGDALLDRIHFDMTAEEFRSLDAARRGAQAPASPGSALLESLPDQIPPAEARA